MKIFLVGGAIRDKKLKLPIYDRDWVVEGATPAEMIAKGFQQVGKDFPVFLHNISHEEYALARTERKSSYGYTGFITYSTPDVTLEQDLLRRDITINAMAESLDGQIIDPYGGLNDLKNKVLRHVSSAFDEDPLRILRVARFAARFVHLGFYIAPETMALMTHMTSYNELHHITPERIWHETQKALNTRDPHIYFQVLHDCGALNVLFKEISNLFGIPSQEKWHPIIDTGIHTLMSLSIAAKITKDVEVRLAVLTHDLGKIITPLKGWPYHYGHGEAGLKIIDIFGKRMCVPKNMIKFAKIVSKYHECIHNIKKMHPIAILQLFNALDVWRKPYQLDKIIMTSEADAKGRIGFENTPYLQGDYLRAAYKATQKVSVQEIINLGFRGLQIRQELYKRHLHALKEWKQNINKYKIYNNDS
ncbi:Multifunctional CCA protein [Candidatus Profftia lariciata]|uniref:multifunctional CCA addition/repair protein n=1 Tax=Candidatus Profftia lariciata TaxID=1987921 RepID=UPI001D00EA04|nr:multifunctional CCA addition/repair protein [Candidatus Profftia lariciata]UDG81412.1 Multifunctional CCA protein [Candidatus Profftia lariciata]